MWYNQNITGGTNVVVTATLGASVNSYKWIACQEYSGLSKTDMLEAKASAHITVPPSSLTVGPLNTTSAKTILWVGYGVSGGATIDGTYNLRSDLDGNSVYDKRINVKGSYSTTATGLNGENSFIYAALRVQ